MGNELQTTRSVDRRRLLQGAAAAGVGVAAWSAPNISTLGFTPAYAQECTIGHDLYDLGQRNTSCSCGQNPGKYAKFKDLDPPQPQFPGTVSIKEVDCAGPLVTNSGSCDAGLCIDADDPNLTCRPVVEVFDNSSGVTISEPGSAITGSGFVELPQVECQSGGDIFIRVLLRCSEDPNCV